MSVSRSRSRRRARRTRASSSRTSTRSAPDFARPGVEYEDDAKIERRRPALRPRSVREPARAPAASRSSRVQYKMRLWTRASSPRSARSSSGGASRRPPSGSASPSRRSASRSGRSRSGSGRSSSTARAGGSSRPRRACGSIAAPSGCSRSRSRSSRRWPRRRRRARRQRSRSAPRPGPAGSCLAQLLCEFQSCIPELHVVLWVFDTQTIVERVAGARARARRRRRRRGATAASSFEPFFRDEVVLACPPGHRFAGKTVTLDELREAGLIVMQEGAGVRQLIEDELRRVGTRLRDLDVRLELGLQESVTSAVRARLRRHVHLAHARSSPTSPRARSPRRGSRGSSSSARSSSFARAGRAETRAARAFVEFARERVSRDRPLVARRAARRARRARGRAAVPRRERPRWASTVDVAARRALVGGAVRPDRGAGRAPTRCSRSAAARRSTPPRRPRRRRGCRSSRCRRRTRAPSGRRRFGVRVARPPDRRRRRRRAPRGDRLRRRPDARPAAATTTVGTALNALAHCAEALYVDGRTTQATSVRSQEPS